MTVTAELDVSLKIKQVGNAFGGGPTYEPTLRFAEAIANGTGAGQADLYHIAERTVADGANDDVDLAGVLADALGNSFAAAELVGFMIINKPAGAGSNTTDLTVGGGTNPFTGFVGGTAPTIGPLKPGALAMLFASDAAGIGTVTAGTGDILRVTNAAGAANTYQIALLGRSA
ncbi:MAG: hypothetical protein MI753_19345 [Hyphomicrobiales bacterium]|nr:hypothetical protein [Hyphomicrobiales bacterium]